VSLDSGAKLGPYEILGPLGAGGMGEVYRARDTRLDRTVAIKILPFHLAGSPEARQRFEREARAISSLSHPNICHLYDVGSQDGTDYLVMEYLEGETLASRLMRGPLPPDQVLKCGIEICEGLDKAHRSGVVHRDLKPGNIMITKSGAKLMDFGLAKATTPAISASGLSLTLTSPAERHPLTAEGTVIGTFQYMSPEQVEGKEADARSDIFALGAVLYEMATGTRAFEGKTPASVIAAVLERNPRPISTLQPASPPALDRVVKACLAKDPDDRWRSVHDVGLQLGSLREGLQTDSGAAAAKQPNTKEKIAWGLVIALTVALAWFAAMHLRSPQSPQQTVRSSLLPPVNWSFLVNNAAVSPDGKRLAFVGVGSNGETSLWVRSLASGAEQQLSGTEDATVPFWSPDSTRLGFFADSKLKIADASGGVLPKTLAETTFGRGGTWNREGTIVFAPDMYGFLYRISENGGSPVAITKLPQGGGGQAHRWPSFLPDGKHFLFSVDWSAPGEKPGNGIYVGSLDGGDAKLVTSEFTGNAAFASGKLLYVRDLTLTAQPFDSDRLQLTGPAAPVGVPQVVTTESFSNSAFSVSETGVLVYHAVADLASQLVWFNAKGEQVGQIAAVGPNEPRLSPDGRFVVFPSDEAGNGKHYLRLYDPARDVATRLTDSGAEEAPAWSPDGKMLVYVGRDGPTYSIYQMALDRAAPPQALWKGPRVRQVDYTLPDVLLFAEFSSGRPRLRTLSLRDQQITPMHAGAEPRLSPDGHWLVYTFSSGHPFRPDVYLEPFPGPGARIQISRSGGAQGTWSRDGKQIFFIAGDKKMMAVTFDASRQSVSAPRVLFQTRIIAPSFVTRQYDVAPDGRFLINSLPSGSAPPLTLLTNWTGQKNQ
jgi:serine/threonine protein kinase